MSSRFSRWRGRSLPEENHAKRTHLSRCTRQPGYPLTDEELKAIGKSTARLVILEVFERLITTQQDASLREPALGPQVDTSTRVQVVWTVRVVEDAGLDNAAGAAAVVEEILKNLAPPAGESCLKASLDTPGGAAGECNIPPGNNYRGAENQLYRVEIHDKDTFKWSRENGAVGCLVERPKTVDAGTAQIDAVIRLVALGKDLRDGLQRGNWVEFEDDRSVIRNIRSSLVEVDSVRTDERRITLKKVFSPAPEHDKTTDQHPLLRLPGDYWLIRANAGDGTIEWPAGTFLPARRSERYVAPLAIVKSDGSFVSQRRVIPDGGLL